MKQTDGYVENVPYDQIQSGQTASLHRRLTLDDLRSFGAHAAAFDPEHMDEQFATSDLFHRFVAGMWGNALLATLIASELPGPGSRILEQHLTHNGPIALGDSVTATVRVREKLSDRRVVLECQCVDDKGGMPVSGTIVVAAPADKVKQPLREVAAGAAVGRRRQLERLLTLADGLAPVRTAVVHPVDKVSLTGAIEAAKRGLIIPVLVGPEAKIRAVAEQEGADLAGYEIVATEHSHEAAERGVAMARALEVEVLMKGALHTDELMYAVVSKERGLRTARRMSQVFVMDVPTYPRPLFITDAALNIYPDLETKRDIVQNAIDLAHALGNPLPKVAILSATESINPKIPSTVDAAALCKMADRGQITGGILDGPLAFDNAISAAAARTKGIESEVAGQADILLAPDLEAANMLAKQLQYLADADGAGIVMGARVPIVLTSRADDAVSRMASCAIALLLAHHKRNPRSV